MAKSETVMASNRKKLLQSIITVFGVAILRNEFVRSLRGGQVGYGA